MSRRSWFTPAGIRYYSRWLSKSRSRRAHVLQEAINRLGAQTYLEIGVSNGDLFERVRVERKLGVDPIDPAERVRRQVEAGARYFQMPSDEFFATQSAVLEEKGLDVAFVDGLHTYAQALADVENCLRWLNPGGIILMHDCNPTGADMATPAESMLDLQRYRAEYPDRAWTGDVWKAVVHLRALRPEVKASVLDCDFGIGVVFPSPHPERLDYTARQIAAMSYDQLAADRRRLLGLRHPIRLFGLIREAGKGRR